MQDRFRFRYSYNNHIYNVLGIDFDFSRAVLHSLVGTETLMCKINLDNLIPCTGKRDRNGILIYEGDIVKIFHVSGTMQGKYFFDVVEWNDLRRRFDTKNYGIIDDDDVYEVIGNIYENPELLEVNERHTI